MSGLVVLAGSGVALLWTGLVVSVIMARRSGDRS